MLRRAAWAGLILAVTASSAWAVGSDKAKFVGGTTDSVKPKAEGRVDLSDPKDMVFSSDEGSLRIPWRRIQTIEYGQNVSRRWKTAIFISPIALLSKGRKHMVTITYQDREGGSQAAVFELGKDIYRLALAAMKGKSGKEIACQDQEARKQFGQGCTLAAAAPDDK
jgi:hypothetical protein